jgi:quaternary ammonium compound-resistance protein SugE
LAKSWTFLILAGVIEVAWALSLKYAEGFTRLWPSVASVVTIIASMYFLSVAMKELPLGLAYGVFVGMGAIGSMMLGIVLFDEPANPLRFVFLALLIASIVGLEVTSA